PELSTCLIDIAKRVVVTAREAIDFTYADYSSDWENKEFPFWLETHPVGRALNALGSAYRVGKKNPNQVGIWFGPDSDDKHLKDPIGLNGDFLREDAYRLPPVGWRDFLSGDVRWHTRPYDLARKQCWFLS